MKRRDVRIMGTGFAVVIALCCSAVADYDWGDSAEFTLDLLSLDPGMSGDWNDSADFSLDLTQMNRDWEDSASFIFSDAPPPAPTPVAIETPLEVVPGEPFDVRVILRNNGGSGDHGGISISFPDLTDTDGGMPPYTSPIADVEVHAETTFATVGVYDAGDTIDVAGTNGLAQHLLVEGDEDGWVYDESQTLTLTVTPYQLGPLAIRVRTWIGEFGTGYGPPTYRWPSQEGAGYEQDQQQYWSQVITVDVTHFHSEPSSVQYVGAGELQEEGACGSGVRIGMLELALPWIDHAALVGRLAGGEATPDPQDADQNHAVLVAGILVGGDNYVVPDLGGYPYRGMSLDATLYPEAVSDWFSTFDIDNAISDLVDAGCEVVNYSGGIDSDDLAVVDIERDINRFVDEDGVSIVVPVGNTSQAHTPPASPAQTYNVIAVGATGNDEAPALAEGGKYDLLSEESVTGPTSSVWNPSGRSKPDVVSAGRSWVAHLWSDLDTHGYNTAGPSTSVACPHVAGGVALLIHAARQAVASGQSLSFVDPYGTVDPRALKSGLLTGADKGVMALDGGDQQGPTRSWQTAGTQQPLDFALGAGGLDVPEALRVLLGESSTDAWGAVTLRGAVLDSIAWEPGGTGLVTWNVGDVTEPTQLTATLVWNAHYDGIVAGIELNNLDLYVMRDGVEEARSDSSIDNVEHVYALLDQAGNYTIEVRYVAQATGEVDPEPFAVSYRLVPTDFVDEPSDLDGDGDVDLADFSYLQECFGQPISSGPYCWTADLDLDDDVDLDDFVLMHGCIGGPNQLPQCAP